MLKYSNFSFLKVKTKKVHIGLKYSIFYIQINHFQIKKGLLTDISSQHIFYLFLLKSALDDKLVISIYRTTVKEKFKKINSHNHAWIKFFLNF